MDLPQLVSLLSHPRAYPHLLSSPVDVRQTHISVVFLAGPYAYKIKKPLDLGFLDFSSLERRHHFCLEEVRLNRRLAPKAYLGVVPITVRGSEVRVDGEGAVVEWAVWMRRLPEEATLLSRLDRGEVGEQTLRDLGRRLADFHSRAERGNDLSVYGRWTTVAQNARENVEQTAAHAGITASPEVRERLRRRMEETLSSLRPLIEARAARGKTVDTHGDLHLDHVYCFPEAQPPEDLVVVDCIEFNERFRYADPTADLAFLAMDLQFRGYRRLIAPLVDAYLEALGDVEVRQLLPFYVSYRAAVRAKVEGFEALEPEVPEKAKARAVERARSHWLLALAELEPPRRKPCLVLVGGLPGSGKSAVARELADRGGFLLISSDVVRKELAGLRPTESGRASFGEGIYTEDWNERTYAECLRRAEMGLFEGARVIVDASFREEARRGEFLATARRWGVPPVFLVREADEAATRKRMELRAGDASDADLATYQRAKVLWEELGPDAARIARRIPAFPTKQEAVEAAVAALEAEGLL